MAIARELKCELFGVKVYSDGFIDRTQHDELFPTASANAQQAYLGAYSKDVVVDSSTGCWARIFLPESAAASQAQAQKKRLPVLFYYHGGGFVVCSAASVLFHDFCSKLAAGAEAIVISVDYRLAPEHKLPAPFDDCLAALRWLQQQALATGCDWKEPWLSSHADFCNCFLMGDSAGGNIVAHLGVRAASEGVHPLHISGLILVIPFFGGVERSNSEILYGDNVKMTLQDTDNFWAVSLPGEGADRSHPYCTFFTPETRALLQSVKLPPSLVVIGAEDLLYDRQIQYVEFVREAGHSVTLLEYPQYDHAILYPEVNNAEDVADAYSRLKEFLAKCMGELILTETE
ncbi:hypothetical protein O6H91_10G009000 [Diphasiastrum complanatum]|uniref:Uncharacterized protein n=1 Tax=Diphasiastrum complanatum TaxID=34168 RepID=A0ACC2CE77_DIPCM|nr:hypothetical protein O6H91_10G009000 [Diphasiastrum complanatum]